MNRNKLFWLALALVFIESVGVLNAAHDCMADDAANKRKPIKVFIFAGQSNMEGADSKIADIDNFPRYQGLGSPQEKVRFSYCIGRENKSRSDGWVELQPVRNMVGPELSFARMLSGKLDQPIAIIKCAAGGTHLGGDWNPDQPSGFKMYPLALDLVRQSLNQLKEQGLDYEVEAFFWHQGENDMFNPDYLKNYGDNLQNFIACWRRDLKLPKLKFFVGELCTKTIWGMDLRPRMYGISLGQKQVTGKDPLVTYVPTAHIGVEIGGGVGLHYHYGTLGQLQHGENYAVAYLKSINQFSTAPLKTNLWPYSKGQAIDLYVLAGHRNMEGERAFTQNLAKIADRNKKLRGWMEDKSEIAFKYSLGGGYRVSSGWEPLGLVDYYDTFGPELSLANRLLENGKKDFAIAKFTHSGSQIIDWTPEGSMAKSRMLYRKFISFIQESTEDLKKQGNSVRRVTVVYYVGENDMSFYPYRKAAAERVKSIIDQSRIDLESPDLVWIVVQQPPTDDERVNKIDAMNEMKQLLDKDKNSIHLALLNLPPQEKKLVMNTEGILEIGKRIAETLTELETR